MYRKVAAKFVVEFLGILLVLSISSLAFAQPLQDHLLYGTVYVNGVALTEKDADYTVTLKVNDVELDSYTMGSYASDEYYLTVHLTEDLNDTTKGHIGESANIYVNDVLADIYDADGAPMVENTVILKDGKMEYLYLYATIPEENDPPVITSTAPTTATEEIEYTYNPVATDADNDTLTWSLSNAPVGMTINSATGTITWTPAEGVTTSGSVTLTVDDSNGGTASEVFTITVTAVNDAPVANDDTASTSEDTPVTIDVLVNDTDADGDTLTVSAVTQPSNGAVTTDGSNVVYTPDADFNGSDSFTYTAGDGTGTDTATVTVTVVAVNDLPVAADNAYSTDEDTALTVAAPGVLGNDSDPDGDALSAVQVSGPSNGTLTLSADGSFTYTPGADFNGDDSFTYKANDGTADSSVATVTISVGVINDPPVISSTASTTATEEIEYTYNPVATDADNDTLTWSLSNAPVGMTINSATGTITWTPAEGVTTSGSVTLTVDDSNGGTASEVFMIAVTPVNEAPVAEDGELSTDEDVAVSGTLSASDADGDDLMFIIVADGILGTVTIIDVSTGAFIYTPNENANGPDSFTFKSNDGLEDSNTATVTITINQVNDPPVADAGPDQADVSLGDVPLDGGGSTDVDEDPITFNWIMISEPYAGAGELNDANLVNPTLVVDGYGLYEVRLEVCDDEDACDFDTVQITTLDEVNLKPVANAGEDKTVGQYDHVCLEGSGSDPNGDEISYNWEITAPDKNEVLADLTSAQPCFMADQIGKYKATLVVNDGELDSEPDKVAISVEGNSKPVADAGEDRNVNVGQEVCLDGSGSSDPDGDDITYGWAIINRPDGSDANAAELDDPGNVNPCFTPDVSGAYLVQLIVTDEHGLPGDPVTVTITATDGEEPVPGDLNGDGIVDRADLKIILNHMNQSADVCLECDLDNDGMITGLDVSMLVRLFTRS